MKIITEYPFEDYNGYIIINRESRKMICLRHKHTQKRKTTSYARYLISVKLKRILNKEEEVDHIDEDKTNDDINNLQVLSTLENIRKNYIKRKITKKIVELKCPHCNINFIRDQRNTFISKKGLFSCCSKDCLHNFLKTSRTREELKQIGENQIIKVFRNSRF